MPDGEGGQRPFLVLDEGQDMPPAFYDALIGLGFERFFVVADQNQQIKEANSSRKEIQDCLATRSWRGNRAQAELPQPLSGGAARAGVLHRRPGEPAARDARSACSGRGSTAATIYDEGKLDAVARGILRFSPTGTRASSSGSSPRTILVRERYLSALRTVGVKLDNPRPTIETFFGDTTVPNVAFDEGGILVINAQACKGLEFDTVVLADIDEHYVRRNDPDARNGSSTSWSRVRGSGCSCS